MSGDNCILPECLILPAADGFIWQSPSQGGGPSEVHVTL